MAGIPLRRRRGPMSAAQKAALKKAQEISARKRRGTGKPDSPTTQRMASLAKKPSAPQYPNEGPSPVVRKRRKAQPKDIMKPTAGDGKTKYQYNPDLSVAENMRLQKEFDAKKNAPKPQKPSSTTGSGGSSKSMGTADPGTMGVSQILKERKELIAKRNGEGLSKEEAARLVAIQAESALRHQNRKAGKGTGPTKVALGDKGNISKRPDTPLQKKMDTAKKSKPADPISGNISQRPDNPDQKDAKDLTDQELKSRIQKLDDLDKQLMARKRKYANDPEELAAIKKRRDRINAQWDEAALEQKKRDEQKKSPDIKKLRADYIKARDSGMSDAYVNKAKRLLDIALERQKKDSPDRFDASGKLTTDKTAIKDLRPKDRAEVVNIRESLRSLSLQWIQRDNVISELDSVKNIGDLVEAAQSVEWYLHEYNAQSKLKPIAEFDKLFAALKKYSDRYRYGKGN